MYSFTDTQEAADAMGMSLESFESMFGRLKDYGDTNNFVSSLEEGALKSEEIDDKLIDAQIKMEKLKASGANQSALDDQQAVIDNLIAQKTGITQAISDFKDGTVDRKIQDIKDAKGAIDELNQAMKDQDINPDSDAGKKYIEVIQEQADKVGLKLTNFEVDEDAYNQLIAGYEAKAKGSQIKHFQDVNEGIESGNTGDYSDSDVELVNKIKDAQEQKSEALQNVIDAVNSLDKDQWNEASQIELGNGAYESEDQGIRNVEDALQGLSDQFGLTKEQATALLPALEALGVVNIDPNVDMTGLDELDQATQDGMASLRQMQADGDIKLSFDVDSSIEGLSVDKLQSQIGELEHIKVNFDVDPSEYKAIQSMIDQREMQMHVQIAVDKTGDIDKLLSLNDEELAQKAELDVDVNTEDGKAKIDELRSSLESLSGDTPAVSVKIDETQFQALTKEQQGQGTVTFKPEHHEVDAYLAEEKKSEGKVKWSNETGLVDVYAATEHYSHGTVHWGNDISAVQTSFTATGTVNWINSGGPSGGLSKTVACSTGTFKAESTGSAYNVLNITPAHASGTNVAIKQDQQALVNEVGVNGHAESIVRDGVWSLIPGGAHIENLKKGDIIFSTTQTDALLKHGAIQGHARAYASGTVTSPGIMKAYAAAGNTPGFHFQGGAATVKPAGSGNSGNSGNSGLQHAIEDNTDAVSDNSDDTSDAADEVSEALQNVIKKLNDNAMDWVEVAMDRLDRITSRYTDLAESDYSHYTKAQKYYNKALENIDKEIKAAKESISVYKRKSEEVANNGEVSKYLTPALKKKVQDGTINIETLDANQKAAVEAYKQWYDKYLDAVQKYRDKKTQELNLAKSKVDNVYDSYDLIISKRKAKEEYYAAKAENRIKSGKSQKVGSVYWKDLEKQVSYAQYQKDWMLKERDKVQQSMTDYLNVNGHNKKDKAYQEMKKNLTDLNTSIVEADTHIQETKAALEETRENLKQWQIDRWERAGDKQDASLSYKKNADDINYQLSTNDYEERLKTYDKIIRADEEKRQLIAEEIAANQANGGAWSNEEMQKKIEEYDNLTASIIKSKEAMQQLAQEEIDFRFKPLDEAQNKLSNLVSELQTAQKLLGDTESFYNDDGAFSTNGLTNILLVQEQIDATKDKIANYREGLNKLDEMYKNGAIGPEYYKTKTDEMLKSLQQESATLADLKQNLLDMYTTQVTKENDLLQENIEKRKDALSAKEKYYDYDKTLKKKTKDINTLKAQIAALEGTSNAASKARLEKLRAELADAEDDMADTMHQHEVDMKNTGYENFSDEANKALDNTLDAVKKNAAFQEAIIGSMLSNVKANYDSTYKHLGDVMDQYGMKVSQTYSQMITKAADFNTAAVNATKAWEGVTKIDTSKPYGGSSAGNSAFDSAMNNAGSSQTAGSPNIKPDTDYTLKLSDTDIYLTYSHIKKQLKATWSPKKPEHSDIEWKSSDESIAKVSSDGTVRGVSSGLNKNGLMARDESKTRKCIITAIGGGGLAKATCTVHVMPDSHYEKIKDYADKAGIKDTSGNNLRDAMEYAYKNGANHSDQSYTAVEGFKKAYLKDWTNSLSNRPDGATDVPAGVSPLIGYFNAKGKKVGPKEMQQLADILQINTPGVKNYDSWGSTLKNKILKAYKSYGFSKGGVVRKGIPASILDIIGGDALIPRGDSMLIGANPGETVLTKEFTDQLKPTVATLNEFNARMAKPITPILPSSSNNTSMNSECNITINVESHPQYTYTDEIGNIYALPEFREYHDQLAVNDFVRLGLSDTRYVKLRVVEIRYNPCDMDETMEVTFSNMVQYKSKLTNDNEFLTNALNQTSDRTGGRVNSVNKSSTSDYVITSEAIKQIFSNPLFNSMLGGTTTGGSGSGGTGSGGTITADTIIAELVKAKEGVFDKLTVDTAFMKYLDVKLISADKITTRILEAEQANIEKLSAKIIESNQINADMINVKNLLAGHAGVGELHTIHLTVENAEIDQAVITNLIAKKIAVGDLMAQNALANQIVLISKDNKPTIAFQESTQQFYDSKGNVRVQIGMDGKGDFNFIVKNGDRAALFDENGITQTGIPDNTILGDMINNATITKDKLGFQIIEPNEQGGIDITNIYDGKGNQWWGIEKTTITDDYTKQIKNVTDTLTGQIETKVSNIQYLKDKESIRTDFSDIKQNVSGITSTVSSMQTDLSEAQEKIKANTSSITQNADKISFMVTGDKESEFTVTDKFIQMISDHISIDASTIDIKSSCFYWCYWMAIL